MSQQRMALRSDQFRDIIATELWRSVAWAGLAFVGWAFIVTGIGTLDATVWTVVVLPMLTWAALTVAMIGLRVATGSTLRVNSVAGLHIVLLEGIIVTGFIVVYLVTVEGWATVPTVGVYLGTTVAYLLYYWKIHLPRSGLTSAQ